jgi:hypothetical protein
MQQQRVGLAVVRHADVLLPVDFDHRPAVVRQKVRLSRVVHLAFDRETQVPDVPFRHLGRRLNLKSDVFDVHRS